MATECSICLEPYKEPVSIPCGHVYCSKCLEAHISRTVAAHDAVDAQCPTCQQEFAFLTPDLTLIMKPLRRHIHPSIRKVFVDVNTDELDALKKKVKEMETQLEEKNAMLVLAETNTRLLEFEKEILKLEKEQTEAGKRNSDSVPTPARKRPRAWDFDMDVTEPSATPPKVSTPTAGPSNKRRSFVHAYVDIPAQRVLQNPFKRPARASPYA